MRILIVEDEHRIAEALKKGLTQESYAVDLAYDGNDGYDLATTESYDLIVLDLMLPGMDGVTICRKLRAENIHTPILILTAKSSVSDRVAGLDNGADDYLTKPFAFEELLARVRALLRRPSAAISNELSSGQVKMDTKSKLVTKDGAEIRLSAKEYALLEYLLRHPNQTVTKEQIISHVWDYDADVLPNTVEAYIKRVRAKLGDEIIETIRGFGYRIK